MGEQRTDMGKSAGTKINTTDENEINELLQELSDCREDERNTANQILSVIGAAGAMLGAILTANIFSASGDKDEVVKAIFLTISVSKQSMIWFSFVLSNTIFCTAFAYVITLGISAALRYHYIRNIEDRLSILIPEENKTSGMGNFVHWTSYSGAFITRVPKHVQGINGWSYFIGYTIAAVGASFFGILMTIILFLMLDEKRVVDYCLLSVPILEIGWAIIAFIAASRGLTKSAERYFEIARARRKERQNKYQKEIENRKNQEKLDSEKETWLKLEFLMYLLYPKTKDFQKALLIPLGYALYTFWMANVPDFQGALLALKSNWKSLFWAMLIFDFLFYQARFQINDICGLKKDIKAEKPPIAGMKGASNEIIGKMVIVSFLVAVVRIMAGIALLYRMPLYSKARMVCCVIILFGVTIIYEVLRTVEDGDKAKRTSLGIFVLVGFGYPLRFLVGVLAAGTIRWDEQLCGMLGAWYCYGLVMVIVAWMMQIQKLVDKETEKLPDSAKLHFKFMYDSREEMKWAVCALMVISLICTALALPRNQDMGGLVRSMAGTFYTIPLFMMFASYIGVLVLLFSKPGSLLEWMRRRKITYNVASFFMGEDCAKDYFGNLEQKKETAGTKNW